MPPTVYGFHDGSACGYYRITLPLDYLAHKGWTVQTGVGWDERSKGYRVIIGQRIGKHGDLPGSSTSGIWRRLLVGHRLVYETDDDFWTVDDWNLRAKAEHSLVVLDAVEQCIRTAHVVTVSVGPLGEVCARHNPNVRVLPNHIDGRLLEVQRPRRDQLVVGWAGGDSHLRDWQVLAPQLKRFLQRNQQAQLHVIGTDFAHVYGIPARHTGWQDLWSYYRSIDFDIGLAPLADTPFNRSKCLHVDTRVSTPWGIVPVAEIRPGQRIWNGKGWVVVEATEQQTARAGLRITTALGYQIVVTPEHRLSSGGQWRQAADLRIGDPLDLGAFEFGLHVQQVPVPLFHGRKSRLGRTPDPQASSLPRVHVDEVWGELLGFFVGDGTCWNTGVRISVDGQDEDLVDRLGWLFAQVGLVSAAKPKRMRDGTVLRRQEVAAASATLVGFLEQLGLVGERALHLSRGAGRIRMPKVPEVIFRSPREVVAAFLRGYFEADGTVTGQGVRASSKDEGLLRGVQVLLLGFGITSSLTAWRKPEGQVGAGNVYWYLTLRRAEADLFDKEIGFVSARKRARLAAVTSKAHSNAYRPIVWASPITSIEKVLLHPVDIEVEGQAFIAAGIVSHNSPIKAIEYGALGIPIVASAVGPYADYVLDGVTGFLVRHEHEWGRYLRLLVTDQGLREDMGRKAKEQAAEWTIQRGWRRWAEVYEEVAG